MPGVDIAGLTFDAGTGQLAGAAAGRQRPRPRAAGTRHARRDPTALQDVFFRVGGPHVGKATTSLEVNSDHTILDDIWAWRADHGVDGVGWTVNTADTGVVVNGDDVTATGLFVEHYQKYNVDLERRARPDGVLTRTRCPTTRRTRRPGSTTASLGYAAYKVADTVRRTRPGAWASYIYTTSTRPSTRRTRSRSRSARACRCTTCMTVSLNRAGTIDHVINGVGGPVTPAHPGPSTVVSYP